MARNTLHERNQRKISRSGNGSYYITLPIEYIRSLEWRERQKVVVEKHGKDLIIKDWKG